MQATSSKSKVIIFDTTLRDSELMAGVKFDTQQKIQLAQMLAALGVDVIEAGYPGFFRKDYDALYMISKQIKETVICGLASSKPDEIVDVALAIKPALRGRIHIYTPFKHQKESGSLADDLEVIQESIKLARTYCDDVEWSAFDALNLEADNLCRVVETAIKSGATTINIPDTFGEASLEVFVKQIDRLVQRVPNIDQATLSVHCHDDRGLAIANSIAVLDVGVRQIECTINGLGARKGNADLVAVVHAISEHPQFYTDIDAAGLAHASTLVHQMTGIKLA